MLSDQDDPASVAQDELTRALSSLEDHDRWALVGTPLCDGVGPLTAGRWGDTAWSGYLPDEMRVHVSGAQALVEASLALDVVGWSGSLAAYDRVVKQRWVRVTLEQLRAVAPDLLPAGAVAYEFSEAGSGPGRSPWRPAGGSCGHRTRPVRAGRWAWTRCGCRSRAGLARPTSWRRWMRRRTSSRRMTMRSWTPRRSRGRRHRGPASGRASTCRTSMPWTT